MRVFFAVVRNTSTLLKFLFLYSFTHSFYYILLVCNFRWIFALVNHVLKDDAASITVMTTAVNALGDVMVQIAMKCWERWVLNETTNRVGSLDVFETNFVYTAIHNVTHDKKKWKRYYRKRNQQLYEKYSWNRNKLR